MFECERCNWNDGWASTQLALLCIEHKVFEQIQSA